MPSERTETHLDAERGLWIPTELREFESQVVIRTPRATIQHFGTDPLDAYYGMIDASHFGDPEEFRDAKNPDLAPDRVRIMPQGEEAVELDVDLEPDLVADGGEAADSDGQRDPTDDPRACSRCGVHIGMSGDEYCDPCAREIGTKPPMERCMECGQDAPQEQMESVDISPPDEYYPTIRHLCPDCSRTSEEDVDRGDGVETDGGRSGDDSEQSRIPGSRRPDGHELGIGCDVESCEGRVVGLDDGWEYDRGIVCSSCIKYRHRHNHWPDEDVQCCRECILDGGGAVHNCSESSIDVLLRRGDECPNCAFELAATDGGQQTGGGERLERLDEMTLDEHSHVATVEAKILFNPANPPEEWAENIRVAVEDLLSDVPAVVDVETEEWSQNADGDQEENDVQ